MSKSTLFPNPSVPPRSTAAPSEFSPMEEEPSDRPLLSKGDEGMDGIRHQEMRSYNNWKMTLFALLIFINFAILICFAVTAMRMNSIETHVENIDAKTLNVKLHRVLDSAQHVLHVAEMYQAQTHLYPRAVNTTINALDVADVWIPQIDGILLQFQTSVAQFAALTNAMAAAAAASRSSSSSSSSSSSTGSSSSSSRSSSSSSSSSGP